tara:strand:- start:596 stop:1555 length:960 start_codon:yes stop_codon:yes gene_type:complete
MDSQLLLDTGLEYDINDFSKKSIVLRDGRESVLWVHEPTGHGILDRKYWENIDEDYYKEDYRQQSSTNAKGGFVEPKEHLSICEKLNKRQYEQFSDRVNKNTKYLEVGCSFGGVAKNVLDFGVEVCDVVEPNKVDAEFIKENFDGITVYNDLLENVNIDKKYNLIVSFEVLEHTIAPIEFLKKCNNLMDRGGFINIEVPNHDDVILRYNTDRYKDFYYHKAHIHYFTDKSLNDICSMAGFDGSVSSFLYYPFFNHVFWLQNNKPQNSAKLALHTPLPTDGKNEVDVELNNFYSEVEDRYDKLINKHTLGDCLVFKGQKI